MCFANCFERCLETHLSNFPSSLPPLLFPCPPATGRKISPSLTRSLVLTLTSSGSGVW